MRGADFAAGLREIAEWYEEHPDLPAPDEIAVTLFTEEEAKALAPELARALAPCEKLHDQVFITLRRTFAGIPLAFRLYRQAVCERRVVGTVTKKALFIPEHEEEVVEWDCHPLLAASSLDPDAPAAAAEVVADAAAVLAEVDATEDEIPF